MAGTKVNDYSIGDSNIEAVMLTTDKAFKGQHNVSLTEYDTTTVPQVAAGSVVEVNGALYKFDANETILNTEGVSDGTVYIMVVPSLTTCTLEYTSTAPAWSDSKQGWYGETVNINNRYVGGATKLSTAWTYKFILLGSNGAGLKVFRDTISFGALEDLSIKTLTIEDLQMYAIGYLELFQYAPVDDGSYEFSILKPVRICVQDDFYSNITISSQTISPGTYRLLHTGSYSDTVKLQLKVGTATVLRWEDIATSGTVTGGSTHNLRFICNYAEGTNSLSDITKIITV